MLICHTIVVTPFMQNARLIIDSASRKGVIIDPGGDSELITDELEKHDVDYQGIWLTHSHLDHCGGVKPILEKLGGELVGHPDEALMRRSVPAICQMYGLPPGTLEACPEPTRYLKGGEKISLGEIEFDVIFTPGHSPGHLSFYSPKEKTIISGDVLFNGSIGRTDLPGGDHATLIKVIREKFFTLPGDTKVLCGHGSDTTIDNERRSNPFFVSPE